MHVPLAFIAQAACELEKVGDLSFFQQQDTIVSHTFTCLVRYTILTHASTTVLCTGKEEGEENPETWGKSYRAAEDKKGRQACSFGEDNKRGTSTHRVGLFFLFFHMHLVMIWHKKTISKQQTQGII